jgi:hypothetical protein
MISTDFTELFAARPVYFGIKRLRHKTRWARPDVE